MRKIVEGEREKLRTTELGGRRKERGRRKWRKEFTQNVSSGRSSFKVKKKKGTQSVEKEVKARERRRKSEGEKRKSGKEWTRGKKEGNCTSE